MVYGLFLDPSMNEEDRQRREYFLNDEIAKRGIEARVRLKETETLMNFIQSWEKELNEAVDAGIERFRAEQ
jgi:hypothetical protein